MIQHVVTVAWFVNKTIIDGKNNLRCFTVLFKNKTAWKLKEIVIKTFHFWNHVLKKVDTDYSAHFLQRISSMLLYLLTCTLTRHAGDAVKILSV